MATMVVYNPRGAFIDGMHETIPGAFYIPTMQHPPGGPAAANTGHTVRVTATATPVAGTARVIITVGPNGI